MYRGRGRAAARHRGDGSRARGVPPPSRDVRRPHQAARRSSRGRDCGSMPCSRNAFRMKAMVRLSLYPPSRPQSIGEVLESGFRLFRATLGHCLPYGALLVIAGELANFYDLFSGRLPPETLEHALEHDRTWWTWYEIGIAIFLLLWGALLLRQDAL